MEPSPSMIKPDPRLRWRCGPRGTGPPKKRRQKSLNGSSSPNGLPNSCEPPRPSLIWVLEILTTIGRIFFANGTKSGNPPEVRGSEFPLSLRLSARLGASQSSAPLIPSPTTSETKATKTTPLKLTFPVQLFFKSIELSYFFFTASTYFI